MENFDFTINRLLDMRAMYGFPDEEMLCDGLQSEEYVNCECDEEDRKRL